MDKDFLTEALSPSRKALFQAVLTDQYPKLGLGNSSTILTTTPEVAETLTKWLQDSSYDMPRSIIFKEDEPSSSPPPTASNGHRGLNSQLQKAANLIPVVRFQDDTVTHAFSHIAPYRRAEALATLKDIFYALHPKGIAVVTCTKRNPVEEIVLSTLRATGRRGSIGGTRESAEEDELRNLAEEAHFELAKIRVSRKNVEIHGQELLELKAQVERILDGILGQTGDGHSWERNFDGVWEGEVERGGGRLVIETFVLVAMKWDSLCA